MQDVTHHCVADDESLLPGLVLSEARSSSTANDVGLTTCCRFLLDRFVGAPDGTLHQRSVAARSLIEAKIVRSHSMRGVAAQAVAFI